MTKQYEKKAVQAELVMVDFDTQIDKNGGGTYPGTNLIYKAFGKINNKGLHEKTFEFKKELRAQLEALKPKEAFTLHMYREEGGKFWNIDRVESGHTAGSPPAGTTKAQGSAPQSFGGPNPAMLGQIMNFAKDLLGYSTEDLLDVNKVREAIIFYKESRALFEDNYEAADNEPQPFVNDGASGAQPGVQENETQDNFDDSDPF